MTTAATSDGLDDLARRDPGDRSPYRAATIAAFSQLHGACFYDGRCNPDTERRIRETALYINDAAGLAAR